MNRRAPECIAAQRNQLADRAARRADPEDAVSVADVPVRLPVGLERDPAPVRRPRRTRRRRSRRWSADGVRRPACASTTHRCERRPASPVSSLRQSVRVMWRATGSTPARFGPTTKRGSPASATSASERPSGLQRSDVHAVRQAGQAPRPAAAERDDPDLGGLVAVAARLDRRGPQERDLLPVGRELRVRCRARRRS